LGLQPRYPPHPAIRPSTDYVSDPRAQAIAKAAGHLVSLRGRWLNPPEWVTRVPEVVPGYPDRLLPVDEQAARELKKRTLTNLYNDLSSDNYFFRLATIKTFGHRASVQGL
jgi:hypothetical protein